MTHSKGQTDWFPFASKYDWNKRTASRARKKKQSGNFFFSIQQIDTKICIVNSVFCVSIYDIFFLSVFHLRTHILCILWHWRLYRTGTLIFVYTLKRYKRQCVMNALSKFELKFHNFFSFLIFNLFGFVLSFLSWFSERLCFFFSYFISKDLLHV